MQQVPQIYADDVELADMSECHQHCEQLLKRLVESVQPRSFIRALDVARGDGRLATSELFKPYKRVYLFDQCPHAVAKAQAAMKQQKNLGYISRATMQKFTWPFFYSAIFMVWCSGYLERAELLTFLRKAKSHLLAVGPRTTRGSPPQSFIWLLENVRDPLEKPYIWKRQHVRSQQELEDIIKEAGLLVKRCSGKHSMPGTFNDVCAWALY